MEFTKPRATLEETLEFANLVREAGGGAPLDALMPSVPSSSKQCLIARNLNFNCRVDSPGGGRGWAMMFKDEDVRDRVAEKLGLETYEDDLQVDTPYLMVLPEEIGQVAEDFDQAGDWASQDFGPLFPEQEELVEEFLPYIEASEKEAYENAVVVDEDGAIL